ncbi:hypothetical protein HT031_004254 [Scenedesmus sp. PABB004]|nr:hypothetical protein HT031_004254 [Scenedesmus sp. PABB004]
MICVVGFDGQARPAPGAKHHRNVRRQRSLLSESLRSSPTALQGRGWSRASLDSAGSDGWSDAGDDCELGGPSSVGSSGPEDPEGVPINYSLAAKARIDAAEQKGRARDEQLEMIHAVRQYMAQAKQAAARAM